MFESYLTQFPILTIEIFGNHLWQYLLALVLLVTYLFVFKIIQQIIIFRLKVFSQKSETDLDDALVNIIETIKPPFYTFVAFYLATSSLNLYPKMETFLDAVLIAWIIYQAVNTIQILIDYFAQKKLLNYEDENDTKSAVEALNLVSKIALWTIGLLLILSNVGIDVTSLIAGLGIGGIAVAFAVKDLLADLFSSFTLYFDKPFRVDDFIIVGGKEKGTVKNIGIKTTRIKSLAGEEIVLPNQKLTSEVIQNYKRMEARRVESQIGVSYDTSHKILEKLPSYIEKIIIENEGVEFGRAHLKELGSYSLVFEFVYTIDNSDYNHYLDIRQKINLDILKLCEQKNIKIAYPTQEVIVKKLK